MSLNGHVTMPDTDAPHLPRWVLPVPLQGEQALVILAAAAWHGFTRPGIGGQRELLALQTEALLHDARRANDGTAPLLTAGQLGFLRDELLDMVQGAGSRRLRHALAEMLGAITTAR